MNGPDLIALKSDDPWQKASTRPFNARHPQFPTRCRGSNPSRWLASSPILSRPKKKSTRPVSRRRLLSLARRLCVCPRGLRLAHAALRGGGTASAPGVRAGRRAAQAAALRGEGTASAPGVRDGRRAARAAQGATHRTCGASGGRGYAAAVRRGTRTAGAGEGTTACGAPSMAGVPRGVSPRLDNRPPMASQGRGSAPTNDWTTCSRLGGGRGWPRGKRSSGQRSRIRGDSHHPAGFSAVPNVPLLTNGQMVRRIQLLLLLLFLLGALLCICRN